MQEKNGLMMMMMGNMMRREEKRDWQDYSVEKNSYAGWHPRTPI